MADMGDHLLKSSDTLTARIRDLEVENASLTEQLDDLAATFNETALKTHALLTEARTVIRSYQENDAVHVDAQATVLLDKLDEALKP